MIIMICEEYCFRHWTVAEADTVAARERFDAARGRSGMLSVRDIFPNARPFSRKDVPRGKCPCALYQPGVVASVHVHEAEDSHWRDLRH